MCKDCIKEFRPDVGTNSSDSGANMLNYKACVKCQKLTLLRSVPVSEEKDEDDEIDQVTEEIRFQRMFFFFCVFISLFFFFSLFFCFQTTSQKQFPFLSSPPYPLHSPPQLHLPPDVCSICDHIVAEHFYSYFQDTEEQIYNMECFLCGRGGRTITFDTLFADLVDKTPAELEKPVDTKPAADLGAILLAASARPLPVTEEEVRTAEEDAEWA